MKIFLRPISLLAAFAALLAPLAGRAETVSALGRIVPAGGVIDVLAAGGDVVEAVLVREGDWVEAGAPLARLRSLPLSLARIEQAKAETAANLATIAGEIALARERVAAAEAETKIADDRLRRIADLKGNAIIAPDKIEERQLLRNESAVRLAAAREALGRVQRSEEVARRLGAVRLTEYQGLLAERDPRAPVKARVLKILTQPGASTNAGVLFKLGDTTKIHVIAEIYEADALKIKPGQQATVSSPALPKKFPGTVAAMGVMILRNHLQSLDPNAANNTRVIEATLAMADREPLERLVFLPVDVTIEL